MSRLWGWRKGAELCPNDAGRAARCEGTGRQKLLQTQHELLYPQFWFFALLGRNLKPDECREDHALKQLPPKCTSFLVKYLMLFGSWCVLWTNLWDANFSFTYFPEISTCYNRNQVSSLLLSPGLVCLGWLLLHSAGGPLGLRKKFHVDFLLKRIPPLIPWCCPLP